MKRINHSNLASYFLGEQPVARAVVIHSSRPRGATCSVDDLDFLREHRPLPEDDDEAAGDEWTEASERNYQQAMADVQRDAVGVAEVQRSAAKVAGMNGAVGLLPRTPDWDNDQEERLQAALRSAGLVQEDRFPPTSEEEANALDQSEWTDADDYRRRLDEAADGLDAAMGRPAKTGT
jgi:hypothetical protein